MHLLETVLLFVGMWASWRIGWRADEWMEKIRSYRVRATETHLILEPKRSTNKAQLTAVCNECGTKDPDDHICDGCYRYDYIDGSREAYYHHNIKGMKWGVTKEA